VVEVFAPKAPYIKSVIAPDPSTKEGERKIRCTTDFPRLAQLDADTRQPDPTKRSAPSGQQQLASVELVSVDENSPDTALTCEVEPGAQFALVKSLAVRNGKLMLANVPLEVHEGAAVESHDPDEQVCVTDPV